jgi:protein-tyrosine phosphatase
VEAVNESRVADRRVGRSGMLGAVGKQWIVDVHAHVVPTGDDGARTIEDGLKLCRDAAEHGTRVLYATPHVHAKWDHYPLTSERLRQYDRAFPVLRAACAKFGLDLRRGFEVYPGALPESADLRDYGLTGSGGYLIEFPGFWTPERDALALVHREAERAEEAGLLPVLAHPERCAQIVEDPERVGEFVDRGWLLALNGLSLDGRHGPKSLQTAWRLLESGFGDLIASDAHGLNRNARLDWAYELAAERLGVERARGLFDGSALRRARDRSVAA